MGLPADPDQLTSTRATVRRSYMSQSSNDSFLLSGSSGSTSASGWSHTSDTQPLVLAMPNQAHRPPIAAASTSAGCEVCAKWRNLSDREKCRELIDMACKDPDRIRWKNPTRTVMLERDEKGSLGFKYKDVKGEKFGKVHTLVMDVTRNGPAHRKLLPGDCILSANKKPLDGSKGKTLQSIVSVNKTQPVCLITQRPEGFKCLNGGRKCSRRNRHQRSISQERLGEDQASEPHKPLDRMDSGEMSTNSSHTSKSSSDVQPMSLDDRLQALADSENLPRLDTLMPRLCSLRVLIAGSESGSLATSLLRGVGRAQQSTNDVGVCYRACVSKKDSGISMDASHEDPKEWITNLLESVADDSNLKPDALCDRVELEIIALKSHPFSTYCQHVLATAHSIFVIQFCCQDFLNDERSVLLDIQRRLNMIRTYASSRAPVYLVMTVEESLPVEQLAAIGKILHRQFATAFMNQLQYNRRTNCPCFQVVRTIPGEQLHNRSKLFVDLSQQASYNCSKAEQCCIVPSVETGSLSVCYLAKNTTLMTVTHPQDRGLDVSELRDLISRAALDQQFITDRYPFSCLLYREQVQQLKKNGPHYAFKAGIKKKCGRITSEKELQTLLSFLHHSGDIICADLLGYKSSNVLLDRQYLVTAAKCLTTIPSLYQQQDPDLQDSIRHWRDLGEKSMASSTFLEHLLRKNPESDPENLLTTLGLMGLVHCLQPPNASSPIYLVPFFFPHGMPRSQQPASVSCSSYRLCLDLHGSIPHGFFMRWLLPMLRRVWKTNGRWSIPGPDSAHLSLANDCEMDVVCDELQSIITVSARCSVTYRVLDLLALIANTVDDLMSNRTDLKVTIGPPCPLPAHQCKVRAGEPGKTHVIDIGKGRAPVPLWCGDDQRVDQYPEVDRWLVKMADFVQVSLQPSLVPIQVSLRTHIKDLPPALFQWLCNRLNASSTVGRDWQGVAGVLGYKVKDVEVFKAQRQSICGPCSSLLLDWARHANATLGVLLQKLSDKPVERGDILTDLCEKWHIVH